MTRTAVLVPLGEAKARVHARLLADGGTGSLAEQVAALVEEEVPLLGAALRQRLVAGVLADVCGLGALEPLLADPEVTEIMVYASQPGQRGPRVSPTSASPRRPARNRPGRTRR